ncbi:MAG: tripartite tricarboxylate transporter substrate binding protein [Burkholderiales bacterium]
MKTKRLQTVLVATATLLAALWSPSSTAQTYPTKPIRIVVPWSAGGSTDAIGRTLAARLSETIGQQVIVENKPGAGGTLGVDQVAKSTPDGYTLTVIELPHASAQALLSKVPYDLNTDLVAIAHLGSAPMILFASAQMKAGNLKEVVAVSREGKGLSFATVGNGSVSHLIGETIQRQSGAKFVYVAYKGGAPALLDLSAGEVQLFFATLATGNATLQTGRIKAIGVTSARRLPALPDVPTVAESGFDDLRVEQWWGLVAPAKTPPEILEKLRTEVAIAMNHASLKERLAALSIEPPTMSPTQFQAYVGNEVKRWNKVARDANIRVED